jgi:hypothetical protein
MMCIFRLQGERGNKDEEEEKIKSGNMSKGHILVPTSWPQGLI